MNKKKIFLIGILILFTFLIIYVINANKGSRQLEFAPPVNGFVPDEATAIKIAEAVGIPIFGNNLDDYKPFHASLKNDSTWQVYGIPKKKWLTIQLGGGPEFEIQKKDGKVLKVNIYK